LCGKAEAGGYISFPRKDNGNAKVGAKCVQKESLLTLRIVYHVYAPSTDTIYQGGTQQWQFQSLD
jgi:hypothetical protein